MARKSKRRRDGPAAQPGDAVEIIVRRGALRRYDRLTRDTADLPVTLTWDRRRGERRSEEKDVPVDSRRHDRRRTPPFTWELADFVVVERAPQDDPADE